jgi:hypothetical protein
VAALAFHAEGLTNGSGGPMTCANQQPSPTEAAERAERMLRVQEAMHSLDPVDREVLALRHLEQLSHAEAAHVSGISPGRCGTSARWSGSRTHRRRCPVAGRAPDDVHRIQDPRLRPAPCYGRRILSRPSRSAPTLRAAAADEEGAKHYHDALWNLDRAGRAATTIPRRPLIFAIGHLD